MSNDKNIVTKKVMVEKINPAKLAYVAEGLRRMVERKQRRLNKWSEKVRFYGRGTKKCDSCGGQMSWCSCCEVWSGYCCEEYGTCQCS